MGELRSSIVLDLQGNLERQAERDAAALGRLGSKGSRSMQVLHRSAAALGNGLDSLGNRYTALLTGAAGLGAAREVINLEERLAYLGNVSSSSREEVKQLYDQIVATAQMPDIRVDPSGILSGVEVILEKLGDKRLAGENLRNIGLVMRATGADGKEAGAMIANFKEKFNIKTPQEMFETLDLMNVLGKAGALTAKDMVSVGNTMTAAYAKMGRQGKEGAKEMFAVGQVMQRSTRNAEQTATSFKNALNDLMDPTKQKYVKSLNVKIWDEDEFKKTGKKVSRSFVDIIGDIMAATKGDPEKLSKIFGMEAMDGISAFAVEWQRSGKNAATEFINMQADGSTTLKDAANAADTAAAAITNVHTSLKKFAESNLAKPIKDVADAINSLDPATFDHLLKIGGIVVGTVGALVLARKLQETGRWAMSIFGKGGAGEKLAGASKFGDAIPVYVVNGPASLWSGAPDGPGGSAPAGKLGKMAKIGKVLGAFGAATGAGAVGYAVGDVGNDIAGSLASKLSGGKYNGEGWLGSLLYDKTTNKADWSNKQVDVGGTLKIEINTQPGTTATVREMKPKNIDLEVDSGRIMRGN